MQDVLATIVAHKRTEVAEVKSRLPLAALRDQLSTAPPVRDFAAALAAPGLTRVIAEVKRASPSAGIIRDTNFDPVAIARAYQAAGAACLSVLTDEKFFQGRLEYLAQVRAATEIPILRKDFVIDPYQVYEARAAGADCVLLIAECLADDELQELYELTGQLGMSALVEIYEPDNLPRVLRLPPRLLGINNRNLKTMEIRLEHTLELCDQVPSGIVLISESGIRERSDVERLEQAGVRAILVGETLMRANDQQAMLRTLIGAL